jgi:hypothetical protein
VEPIISLPDPATGTYLIVTTSGSRYLINYDRMTLTRITSAEQTDASTLRRDGEEINILTIGPCTVGHRLLLVVDLHVPGVDFTFRPTTEVVSIEQVDWDATSDGNVE